MPGVRPQLDPPQPPGCTDSGPSDAPVVVMLHSSMSSRHQWRGLSARLAPCFRVISIDLHGYGDRIGALPPGRDFGLWREVELVQATLAGLLPAGRRYHVVGHSYGAAVALRLAHAAPVLSLTLYEPTAFHLVPADDPVLGEVRAVGRDITRGVDNERTPGAVSGFIDFWNGAGSYAQLTPERRALMHRLAGKVALDFQALFGDSLSVADVRGFDMPLCLLSGTASPPCVHAVAGALALARPDLERHWFDAGHMAPLTHAHLVDPVIAGFLARQAVRPAAHRA